MRKTFLAVALIAATASLSGCTDAEIAISEDVSDFGISTARQGSGCSN